MILTFQPIRMATGFDEEQRLVAVLTHLSGENEMAPGCWKDWVSPHTPILDAA